MSGLQRWGWQWEVEHALDLLRQGERVGPSQILGLRLVLHAGMAALIIGRVLAVAGRGLLGAHCGVGRRGRDFLACRKNNGQGIKADGYPCYEELV